MATTTDLNTLVINYLTEAQYEAEVSGGTVDPDALYLTPASGSGVDDVEVDGVSVVSGGVAEIDLTGKSDVGHTHTKSQITDFPTIPTITDTYSGTSSNGMSGKAVKQAIDALDGTVSGTAGSGKTLTAFSQTDGKVSATFGNISITKSQVSDFPAIPTITDTYSGTSSDGMSGKAVKSAIDALDGTVTGTAGSGKTLTAFSQTDGKVSATFGNISITKSQVSDFPTLATVATSGDYDDLTDKPTIPTITDTYSGTSSNGMSGKAVKSAIDALDGTITGTAGSGKTLTAFSQTDGKVSATFGNISITKSQVSDFPTIPTVNNATLTIQKNGTTVNTFTANASSNVTANITVPTDTGDLTNGAGFITGYTETDPVFSASDAAGIDATDISAWNGAVSAVAVDATVTTLYANLGWVAP